MWHLLLKSFFEIDRCIRIGDIQSISIIADSKDGWNIDSIITFAVINQQYWAQISANLNAYRWIDTNTKSSSDRAFQLSLTKPPPADTCI